MMKYPINYNKVKSELEFYSEVVALYSEAQNYLKGFKWCARIIDSDLYLNLGSVLCVFVFKIENVDNINDNLLWVIVGDLPPMYLDTYGAKTTKEALEDYVRLAGDWINKVKEGKSIDDCYPFNAEPTVEMAVLLNKRVGFLRDTLIDNLDDITLQMM